MINRINALLLSIAIAIAPISPAMASQDASYADTSVQTSGLGLMQIYNLALKAAQSCNSGAVAPNNLQAGAEAAQCWADTSVAGYTIIRRYDGTSSNWIEVYRLDTTNHILVAAVGGGTIPTLASATTTDLGSVPQPVKNISGTTSITSFGSSAQPGTRHTMIFQGALTITYNAASLILPGAGNITTANGDLAEAIYLGSGNWRVVNYTRADGTAVANPALPLGSVVYGDFAATPTGFAIGDGSALLRTSFPAYLAAVTKAVTATRTSGNATLTSVGDTSKMGVGMPVEGAGIAVGCTIASLVDNTSITLNSGTCVTANGATTITVFLTGYGTGGDSTTVGLKDCQGRALVGRDPSAARVTTAGSSINGKALNASGGAQNVTMAQSALPNATLSVTGTVTTTASSGAAAISPSTLSTASTQAGESGPNLFYNSNQYASIAAIFSSGLTASLNGNVTQTAVNKMPPVVVAECVVRVLP